MKSTASKYIAKIRAKRCDILVPFPHGVNLTSKRIFVRYITVSEAANSLIDIIKAIVCNPKSLILELY